MTDDIKFWITKQVAEVGIFAAIMLVIALVAGVSVFIEARREKRRRKS